MLVKSVSGALKRTCLSVTPLKVPNDMGCADGVLCKSARLVNPFVSVVQRVYVVRIAFTCVVDLLRQVQLKASVLFVDKLLQIVLRLIMHVKINAHPLFVRTRRER